MEIIETNLQFRDMSTREATERIILHHADAKKCSAEDIHRWHLKNGWSGAGYHFLVRKDGKIYRLRPEDKVGAHAYGSNYNSLGICFEGNFMEEDMPEAQKQSGKELVAYLKDKYGITTVQRHKDVCATSCPGNKFPFEEIANSEKKEEIISKPQEEVKGKAITSPMVGTFYAASSPDAAPFVEVGSTVNVGDVVCIIEAMKLMNEIKAEQAGKVTQICVKNGDPIEFGQVLMYVE